MHTKIIVLLFTLWNAVFEVLYGPDNGLLVTNVTLELK